MVTERDSQGLLRDRVVPNVVIMLPINTATAEVVRGAIAQAGRTEESVAACARIKPKTWQRRIRGTTSFSVTELFRISRVLDVELARLLEQTESAMTTADELRLYTPAEAADRLLVSEDWLIKRIRAGEIPARKRGRRWAMSADDIRAAIELMAVPVGADDSRGGAEE